jgi:isopentenyl-diphosphate delta-isomerase type 1
VVRLKELLSVVDEDDNLIRGEERRVVHSSTLWHRGVHVFIFNSKGELLVQLRSRIKDKYPNTYDCSLSGQVTFGEDYETTALRELGEELGIGDVEIKPILHFRMPYGPRDYMICKLFRCNYEGTIKPNEEVSETKFLEMDELKRIVNENPEMLTPWFVEMLKWHFKMKNRLHIFNTHKEPSREESYPSFRIPSG